MKRFKAEMALALAATVLFGTALAQTPSSQTTITGVVSDSMCGQNHMMKGKSDAECTRVCVKAGMKYALVVGKHIYALEGREAELDEFAGQKVTVAGALNGEAVAVKSVVPAK